MKNKNKLSQIFKLIEEKNDFNEEIKICGNVKVVINYFKGGIADATIDILLKDKMKYNG